MNGLLRVISRVGFYGSHTNVCDALLLVSRHHRLQP